MKLPLKLSETIGHVQIKDANNLHVLGYSTTNGQAVYLDVAKTIVKCVNDT